MSAWATGHIGMRTWYDLAWELQLLFYVPSFARDEALAVQPHVAEAVDALLTGPYVVLGAATPDLSRKIRADQETAGVFDPLASWVVRICRDRGWSAMSTDGGRLRRVDPSVEIDHL